MALIHFVSHAKLNNFLTNQQHRITDFEKKLLLSHIHAYWANIDELHTTQNTYRVYSQIFSHFLYHLF